MKDTQKFLDELTARATEFGIKKLRDIDEAISMLMAESIPEDDPPTIFTVGEPVPVVNESEFEKIYAALTALNDKLDELSIAVNTLASKKKKRK